MARMSPIERRDAIVAAAARVIVDRGIAATTVRDVAAEMGTSSGLIHHYFESMDALLAAAFADVAGRDLAATERAVAEGSDGVDRLARFIATYARTDPGSQGMQLWLDAWAEAARRPVLQQVSSGLNVAWQRLLRDVIEQGCAEGRMGCLDPDAAAWRILSALDGLALQSVAHGDVVSRTLAATWGCRVAEQELGLPPGALALRTREVDAGTA